jgi:hypothetical protein
MYYGIRKYAEIDIDRAKFLNRMFRVKGSSAQGGETDEEFEGR